MKYLLLQLLFLLFTVMILIYFISQVKFIPLTETGTPDWYNISTVLFLLFLLLQSIISLTIFLVRKFLTCGLKEFPSSRGAIKWGILSSFLFVIVLVFNIFHIVSILWGAIVAALILLALFLVKV
jgi:hypothetical protein